MATIGIKIANGEFYSILEENTSFKKKLILTTVHDKQQSVRINLHKSNSKTMADALHIGTMVVDDIRPKASGDAFVGFCISSDPLGNINAEAFDMDPASNKNHQYLNINLNSLEKEKNGFNIFGNGLGNNAPPLGLYEKSPDKQKRNALLPFVFIFCALLAVFFLWFFFLRRSPGPMAGLPAETRITESPAAQPPVISTPPQQLETPPQIPSPVEAPPQTPSLAETPPQIPSPLEVPPQTPSITQTPPQTPSFTEIPPLIQAPAARSWRTVPPVYSYRVPSTIPREGIAYQVRFGDTLWDIAEVFYRNPWLYTRIANFNNIRNPNYIISGTTIRIPPRN